MHRATPHSEVFQKSIQAGKTKSYGKFYSKKGMQIGSGYRTTRRDERVTPLKRHHVASSSSCPPSSSRSPTPPLPHRLRVLRRLPPKPSMARVVTGARRRCHPQANPNLNNGAPPRTAPGSATISSTDVATSSNPRFRQGEIRRGESHASASARRSHGTFTNGNNWQNTYLFTLFWFIIRIYSCFQNYSQH
jgi:hypothetical protein